MHLDTGPQVKIDVNSMQKGQEPVQMPDDIRVVKDELNLIYV